MGGMPEATAGSGGTSPEELTTGGGCTSAGGAGALG